jgi:hypothetical protein
MTCVGEKSFAPLAQHTAPVLFSSLKQKELDSPIPRCPALEMKYTRNGSQSIAAD